MNGTATNLHAIATLSPQAMMELHEKAQARVADILEFATTIGETGFYLRHYSQQREECLQEGDISAAVFCEFVLTNLEKALAAH